MNQKDTMVRHPRIAIVKAFTAILCIYGCAFIFIYYSLGNTFLWIVHVISLITVIINYLLLKRTGNFERATDVFLGVGLIISVSLFASGGLGNTGYLWPFPYIVIVFFLADKNAARNWVILLFAGCLLAVALQFLGLISMPYSGISLFNFFAALLLSTICSFLFQRANINYEGFLLYSEYMLLTAPDAVIVIDSEGKIIKWNSKAKTIFGWTEKEVTGKLLSETIIPHRYREAHRAGLNHFSKTGEGPLIGHTIEMQAMRRDHSEFDVALSISSSLIKDKYFFIGFLRDITEKKKAEERIKLLNEDLEDTVSQLKSVNKEMEAFSYSVSHDLRAPLRIIDAYAEMLTDDYHERLDEDGKKLLDTITNSSRRMRQLIDDLLNLSKLGKTELLLHPVSMDSLVATVIKEQLKLISPDRIEIKTAKLHPANCDRNLMHQVWANLLSNAIKYSGNKEKSIIEIGSYQREKELIYYVKDNGVGFDMQYYDQLFGIFQRLHKAADFEGTGVGLANVQRIIMKHNGRVWAHAEVDKGATFYFSLPAD